MNQEQIQAFYEKNFYYIVAGGVLVGLLFGLVPLVVGIRRKRRDLGIIALISSAIVGGFAPILSIFVAAGFTVFILLKSSREKTVGSHEAPQSEASE